MLEELLVAIGLLLVIEGLFPSLNPRGYRQMMRTLAEMPDRVVRGIALASMIAGAVLIYFVKNT
ncbi:MAG TPA: DUF2065 domain-containing protein [Gammaproteobacteria bacterium]|nr:DUF2065 domain-containing protein [Gammaproteobacteria bacterium]